MIPDGREGPVIFIEGEICGVMAYGEKYVVALGLLSDRACIPEVWR